MHMPILAPEPFAFPANPFTPAGDGFGPAHSNDAVGDGQWMVMHTKSRAEKALARRLLDASVRFFLPLYKNQSSSRESGRVTTVHAPLFPGYLFVWGDADARYRALASKLVAQCLPVFDQTALEDDLAAVYRLMTGDLPLVPVQQIPVGTEVEVTAGPFAGLTGRMARLGSRSRLIVEVRMINQGVAVELDRSAVRVLTENGDAERARLALLRR
jgi:transcription antitermination factor NusG